MGNSFHLATFSADVTVPLGHALLAGAVEAARRIDDPLSANGVVLLGAGQPIVLAAIDWCEIRNDAHDRWRAVLAEAAHTVRERVLVTSVHQHDAPLADLYAQQLAAEHKVPGGICDPAFHERAVERTADALRSSLRTTTRVTHVGVGQAKVEKVASARRILGPDGKVALIRNSATTDAKTRDAPEGTIDPWLKTLSFWDAERPVAALSCYATHPMSYYGQGGVSADFVGLARRRRQADDPAVKQIYLSGCGANVTAGKYNDGSPGNRPVLADRIYRGMRGAWSATKRQPLAEIRYRSVPLRLEPRQGPGFTLEDLNRQLGDPSLRPLERNLAALGLSWRRRVDGGHKIDVPAIDLGAAQLVLLPGETFVEYQLQAQEMRPDGFVMVVAYGECAPGYIPLDKNFVEGGHDLDSWCWIAPGSERAMREALREALGGG